MLDRYSTLDMRMLWGEKERYERWKSIEVCVLKVGCDMGYIPHKTVTAAMAVEIDVNRIMDIERTTRHDVEAFVQFMESEMGQHGSMVHWGVCSSDIVDTGYAMAMRGALGMVTKEMQLLRTQLRKMAFEYSTCPMAGRTHGKHAEPITLGLRIMGWYHEISRCTKRVINSSLGIRYGKISGSVGTYSRLSPATEERVLDMLGLKVEKVSTQIIPRDRYAEVFCALAITAGSLGRIANDLRLMSIEEVDEAREGFGDNQVGSSSMPHKRNPIGLENICGLSRIIRGYAMMGLSNMETWDENDISHSSVERVAGPDATSLTHTAVIRLRGILETIRFDTGSMARKAQKLRDYQGSAMSKMVGGFRRQEAFDLARNEANPVNLEQSLMYVGEIMKR